MDMNPKRSKEINSYIKKGAFESFQEVYMESYTKSTMRFNQTKSQMLHEKNLLLLMMH